MNLLMSVVACGLIAIIWLDDRNSAPIGGKPLSSPEPLPAPSLTDQKRMEEPGKEAGPFTVLQNGRVIHSYSTFAEAFRLAESLENASITHRYKERTVWKSGQVYAEAALIDAPLLQQMPELARGCEVTSLAMMLQHAGIDADKMQLAREIQKDPTPYSRKNGVVHFGHPNTGFVGDMYSFSNPGYGVYHKPISKLAEAYLPGRVIDLTGSDLESALYSLQQGKPVWVIINSRFSALPESMFQTWQTPSGPIRITYREHSVLLTGFDDRFVYFNDPLAEQSPRKAQRASFQEAWEQMGRQAITYS
ncbi:C39 family peptidase [Paenibacillus albicereus]|nr:C39 family peptidase [Paenibacillus albicereus]